MPETKTHQPDPKDNLLREVFFDPQVNILIQKVANCELHKMTGLLDEQQLQECSAAQKLLRTELSQQIKSHFPATEILTPDGVKVTLRTNKYLPEIEEKADLEILIRAETRHAFDAVADEQELWNNVVKAGLEARKNPTDENIAKALDCQKDIHEKAKGFLSDDVQKNDKAVGKLNSMLDSVMEQMVEKSASKEEATEKANLAKRVAKLKPELVIKG